MPSGFTFSQVEVNYGPPDAYQLSGVAVARTAGVRRGQLGVPGAGLGFPLKGATAVVTRAPHSASVAATTLAGTGVVGRTAVVPHILLLGVQPVQTFSDDAGTPLVVRAPTTVTTAASVTSAPTYTLQTGFPVINENDNGHSGAGAQTTAITVVASGDLIVVYCHEQTYTGTQHVTSISDTNSKITWQSSKVISQDSGDDTQQEMWYGVAHSTGATTVTVNWADTTVDSFTYVWEFHTSDGGTWSVAQAGNIDEDGGDSITVTWPNLTSSSSQGGIYVGAAYLGEDDAASGGHYVLPTSFSYDETTFDNICIWNAALADGTSYSPTTYQASASGWDTVAVIFQSS